MPRLLFSILILVTVLSMAANPAAGQEEADRPRIGLCLAGGGARGGAHIGVLKVLEELHVPVDYIAGTSIGAIVGGLYASGMTPAEMDSVVPGIDWAGLFDDSPDRFHTSFRRKEEDRIPLFGVELGAGSGGIKAPTGVVMGQKLMLLLRELTLSTAAIDDFDDLPIPFRAVASDLEDGSMVVLDHGTVADAMRASMAIPGAFSPHEIDGRFLVDGGLLRNTPYDVVRDMGADIVIVVDITKTPGEIENEVSLMTILMQTVEVTISGNAFETRKQLADEDVLLIPDLDGILVESFPLLAEASARGETVAWENAAALKELALPEAEFEAWRAKVAAARGSDRIMVDDVVVESVGRIDPKRVAMQVKSQGGQPLDLAVLEEDLNRIYRLGEFEKVDYSFEPGRDLAARDLIIKTRDKRWGPNYLRFGLSLSGHLNGQSEFLAIFYHRLAAVNRLGAEWRNIATVGDLLSLDTEFYQPVVMSGRFFVAPRLSGYIDKREHWLTPDLANFVSSHQYSGSLDLGLNMWQWGELRLGAYAGHYSGNGENDSLDLDDYLGGWQAGLNFDRLDDYNFPNRGWLLRLDSRLSREGMGATSAYDRLAVRFQGAATTGRTSLEIKLEGGTSFKSELPFYDRFELGGFTRLSGYTRGRLFGDDAAVLALGARVKVLEMNPVLGKNLYLGLWGETGRVWNHDEPRTMADFLFGVTGYVGLETILGPVYAGYGWTEPDQGLLYLMLGRVF